MLLDQNTFTYIKNTLLNKKAVLLPGLGTLVLKRSSAHFSGDQTILYPPNYYIEFSDQLIDSLEEHRSSVDLTTLAEFITSTIFQNQKAEITGLGSFYKDQNETVHFTADSSLLDYFNPGYEALTDLAPIKKTFTPTTQKPVHQISTQSLVYEKSKPASEKFYTPKPIKLPWKFILPFLMFVTLALCFMYCPRPPLKLDYFEPKSTTKNTTHTTITTTKSIPETVEPKVETVKLSKSDSITVARKKLNLPCAIITGSFKKSKNILKMTEKLNSLGYEVYTEDNDSTTRIGIKYDCSRTQVDTFLEKVRKEIENSAWVLQ